MSMPPRRGGIALVTLGAILALPLAGVWISGGSLEPYLEFPPRTRFVEHEPFSLSIFLLLAILIAAAVGPFVVRMFGVARNPAPLLGRAAETDKGGCVSDRSVASAGSVPTGTMVRKPHTRTSAAARFPWWGWMAVVWTGLAWTLAWTRFEWMGELQFHTFIPLWVGYIVVMNALTVSRIGSCVMLREPGAFVLLFPLSAAFWWTFEYLNRFVQNWHYLGAREVTDVEYALLATLPFSTVLPAVLSTAEWLGTHPSVFRRLERAWPLRAAGSRLSGWIVTAVASVGLAGIGLLPNYLFPLVWIAPGLLITGLKLGLGEETVLSSTIRGDWRVPWLWALAALLCGFFWELWNAGSLAHWEYAIPFVHQLQLFEMPLLGYAGYLPFGIECLALVHLFVPALPVLSPPQRGSRQASVI